MATVAGAGLVTAPGWTARPRTDLALIDCDIHQTITKPEDLHPYLARVYREQLIDQGLRMPGSGYFTIPLRAGRNDLSYGASVDSTSAPCFSQLMAR